MERLTGTKNLLIIAHRGASSKAPENTLIAYETAWKHLADAIEIDLRKTKDGVLVCAHDNNFNRVSGSEKNISESNFLRISAEELIKDLPKLYKRFDTPISTVSIYIYDLLLKEAKFKGYNYILNGGSADALFAGNYPAFMYNLADLYLSDQSGFNLEAEKWIKNFGTKEFPKSKSLLIEFWPR